tara:strand:- start:1392 stop:3161 length:1770 start_codon:yes stop_codon:yes gene_type:complete
MQIIKKITFLLTIRERRVAVLLMFMSLIMALLDMIGVASILPFIAVLTNPSIIESNSFMFSMYNISKNFGVNNSQQFLFALGVFVFLLFMISILFKAINSYLQARFIIMREYSIGKRLMEVYLNQPYSWFLNRHSADLGKTILLDVAEVVGSILSSLIELASRLMAVIALTILLIIVDPKLATVVFLALAGAYGLIYRSIRTFLNRIGKDSLAKNKLRNISIREAFGAVREVKVGGLEQVYVNYFAKSALKFHQNQASAYLASQTPRYLLEAVAFGGILLMILYLMMQSGSFDLALPVIGLYVFAGYRLMPALQQIYASFTKLSFSVPVLNKVYDDAQSYKPIYYDQNESALPLKEKIELKNIHYSFPKSSRTVIKDISLTINSKSIVGLVGTTGSGKTTTVDIILGLLKAQKGFLKVDGQIIAENNSRSWQRSIGYVPQHIYLSDDTISANVAFGVDPSDINQEVVEKVAKIANLHDFVVNELPEKYKTTIGENGIRLSGGQRQRLGLARALYHNPQLLVLDEATSALDNKTEKIVMDSINNLNDNVTIIIIAHRLNTLKNCDIIYKLEDGRIAGQGTYEELIIADKK